MANAKPITDALEVEHQIDWIINQRKFDFEKVQKAMRALGWGWVTVMTEDRIPSIEELKAQATKLLWDAAMTGFEVSLGGFRAFVREIEGRRVLELAFVLEHDDAEYMPELPIVAKEVPSVGEELYVPSDEHVEGGRARINDVEKEISYPLVSYRINFEGLPMTYNYAYLKLRQDKLQKEYYGSRAKAR